MVQDHRSRRTLRLLEAHGADEFYRGEIARAIVAKSKQLAAP